MANRYDISFNNQVEDDIQVLIEPRQEYDLIGNPIPIGETIYLDAVANSFFLSSNLNDDDKTYCGILPKELQFGYVYTPQNEVGIETFVSNDFDYWKVTCRVNNEIIFQGFLTTDASQPLMNRNSDVILKAVDGLGALKSFEAYNEEGKNTPLFHLVQCLGPLGLTDIRLRTLFNVTSTLMPGRTSDPTFDPLDNIWIEDKIFEGKTIYDAIDILCRNFRCRLYQEGGYWWFEHIGERLLTQPYSWSEYEIIPVDGLPYDYTQTDNQIIQDVRCLIGHDKEVKLVNADAIKYIQLPKQSAKLVFNYKYPDDIFCNQRFDEMNIPISTSETERTYMLECWEHYKLGSLVAPEPPSATAYIYQELDSFSGEEIGRYAVLPTEEAIAGGAALYSPLFEIGQYDRFRISITRRLKNGYDGSGTEAIAYIVLFGDNGNNYFVDDDGEWFLSNAGLSVNAKQISYSFGADENRNQWITVTVEAQRVPTVGRLQIILLEYSFDEYPNETWFRDIEIDLRTFVGVSEFAVIGDYNLQTEPINAIEKIEQEVQISDTPPNKRNILGGLYRGPDVDAEMRELYPQQWDYYGNFVAYPRRFTNVMSAVLHSHTRRSLIKIEGSFKSYSFLAGTTLYQTGFLPRYQFTDFSAIKEFMLTGSYSVDLTTGICRAVFVETLEDKLSSDFGESTYYEFQYITE